MKITLWCAHKWVSENVDSVKAKCVWCFTERVISEPEPKVKVAWGYAKNEEVLINDRHDS